jgi:hypothetical protein
LNLNPPRVITFFNAIPTPIHPVSLLILTAHVYLALELLENPVFIKANLSLIFETDFTLIIFSFSLSI